MTSGAPWWAFIATAVVSLIAVGVSIFSVWYTAKKSSRRELDNWIRQTLLIEIHRYHEKINQLKIFLDEENSSEAIKLLDSMINDFSTLLIAGSKDLNRKCLLTLRKITRIIADTETTTDEKNIRITLLQLDVSNQLRMDLGIKGVIEKASLENLD